ncbi:MAG: hypothetical protein F6K31_03055 [Symploca sp. SIO2G7]|nr:hypothetical protein [Symploca sp. SIO2G7]
MPKTNKNKLGQTFHPLTEQVAREWYKLKFLNTPGYLLTIKSFFTKPDSDFVIPNVAKFCREWGISKSAFYRAINTLTSMGKLSWEATEGIVLKPHNKVTVFPQTEQCPTNGTVSHERDGDSHERDGDSHERDGDSHERDGDSHERDTPIYKDCARNRSNTDLNTDLTQISPLTPQGEQSVCKKSSSEEEVTETLSSLVAQKREELNPTHQTLQKVKDSAAPIENGSRYQKKLDGSDHLPWETIKSPREFEQGFEEWMSKSLADYPAYQGLMAGELLTKVRKHISAGKYDLKRRDELEIEWGAYSTSKKSKQPSQPLTAPSYTIRKPPKVSPEEKAATVRDNKIKILKAIPEGDVWMIPDWLPGSVRSGEIPLSKVPLWMQEKIEF